MGFFQKEIFAFGTLMLCIGCEGGLESGAGKGDSKVKVPVFTKLWRFRPSFLSCPFEREGNINQCKFPASVLPLLPSPLTEHFLTYLCIPLTLWVLFRGCGVPKADE